MNERIKEYLTKYLNYLCDINAIDKNDRITRKRIKSDINFELEKYKSDRLINNYIVVCDETNNPQEVIERGDYYLDVYVKYSDTAEFNQITMTFHKNSKEFRSWMS